MTCGIITLGKLLIGKLITLSNNLKKKSNQKLSLNYERKRRGEGVNFNVVVHAQKLGRGSVIV